MKARCDALEKDSLQTTHAISTDVQSSEQIEEIFDDLSYIKVCKLLLSTLLNNTVGYASQVSGTHMQLYHTACNLATYLSYTANAV